MSVLNVYFFVCINITISTISKYINKFPNKYCNKSIMGMSMYLCVYINSPYLKLCLVVMLLCCVNFLNNGYNI